MWAFQFSRNVTTAMNQTKLRPPIDSKIVNEINNIVPLMGSCSETEWRPAPLPGYEVSYHGLVRNAKTHRLLTPRRHTLGYIAYYTHIDSRFVHLYAHQAVAYAWHGPCPRGKEVDHKDHDRANNLPENLRYVTHRQNCRHRRPGLRRVRSQLAPVIA